MVVKSAKETPDTDDEFRLVVAGSRGFDNYERLSAELDKYLANRSKVREEGMKTLLPYSMKPFGVPENVYIIGTMNTADRSIATIDTALRRRFEFKEMLPDPEVAAKISVGNLSIKELLSRMNRRIAVLYDREHTIGHAAYFSAYAKIIKAITQFSPCIVSLDYPTI